MALFKAQKKTSEELSVQPVHSHVREALCAMDTINTVEVPRFLDNVNRLTAKIFDTPATDSELSATKRSYVLMPKPTSWYRCKKQPVIR